MKMYLWILVYQKAKVTNIKETSKTLDLSSGTYSDIYEEGTEEANVLIAIRSYYGALVNYLLTNLKGSV